MMRNAELVERSVLAFSQWQEDYTVDSDACYKQIGYVLLRKQLDGIGRLTG